MTIHLNDEQLQEIAAGKSLENKVQSHYKDCDHCQKRANEYKTLFQHLKMEPAIQLSNSFLSNLMKQLPSKKTKFSLDILWIVLGSLFSFGVFIYFIGIKPFQNLTQSINGSIEKSVPMIWEPILTIMDKLPISSTQFLMGSIAIIFIIFADILCRQLFTHSTKKS